MGETNFDKTCSLGSQKAYKKILVKKKLYTRGQN